MTTAIYLAASLREVDLVEKLLEDLRVAYSVRPETLEGQALLGGACYQGLLFEVPRAQATHCRDLLRASGLGAGVIEE